jgi:hypothetical protein
VIPALNDEELESIIQDGQGYMQGQDLENQELSDVMVYLRTTFP